MVWFAGHTSGDAHIDALRESSGGNALQAALGLCGRVDLYGAGLLAPRGVAGPKLYTHFFDKEVGDCLEPRTNESAALLHAEVDEVLARDPTLRQRFRTDRVGTELLLHVMAAFGAIRWLKGGKK